MLRIIQLVNEFLTLSLAYWIIYIVPCCCIYIDVVVVATNSVYRFGPALSTAWPQLLYAANSKANRHWCKDEMKRCGFEIEMLQQVGR